MARRITTTLTAATVAWAMTASARPAAAAVSLASLGGATVQTLIDLGGDGVTAGHERYYDFAYSPSAGATAATAVRVQGTTAGAADQLRFVSTWLASGGRTVGSTVSFDVAPVDPGSGIAQLSLLSNGTAVVPAAGTFVTDTASATTPGGEPAGPVLSTFDDGRTTPVDTTGPDVDSALAATVAVEPALSVTDTVTATSAGPGVATASVVQNGFTVAPVPEPTAVVVVLAAAASPALARRRRRVAGE